MSENRMVVERFGIKAALLGSLALAALVTGCGDDGDPRFAARTDDEYTEPLVDAVIGTPSGTTVVDGNGDRTQVKAGALTATTSSPAAAKPKPPKDGGAGGTTGTGGSTGTAGSTGTGGSGSMDAGAGGSGSDPGTPGFGMWHFDDCSATSHFLRDSSGFGANAQQELNAACVAGISNLGVRIRGTKDVVQVPDQPQFTVSKRVAVAAWVNPDNVSGDQPIVIKRLDKQTSFSLGIHNGNIEMSVVLTTGKTIISSAPIAPGVWTHVAGMYDGTFVFLFINGQQFGQVFGGADLRNVFAPLRFGATTSTQFLHGVVDDVFVSTEAISKETLTALSCVARSSSFTVSPISSGPTPFDTNVHYSVNVSNNDVGACEPRGFSMFLQFFEPGISANITFPPGSFQSAIPGQTVTFGVDVQGTEDAEPGTRQIPFTIFSQSSTTFESLNGALTFDLAPGGCFVARRKELMITSTGVVDDPRALGDGPWSFGHMLREMAPTPEQAPALAQQLFEHWLTDQVVNGFSVPARPAAQQQILDAWPRTPAGELDLDRAPFRLMAIVNRFDLRDPAAGSAGQGRLVYGLLQSGFFPTNFTVILEYNLPASTPQEVTDWANRWHELGALQLPSEPYNVALEAITRRFTDRGAAADGVNGSSLLQLRTNDFHLTFRWELREFQLSADSGLLAEVTVKETPDVSFNGTQAFANFVNQNAAALKAVVPGAASNIVPEQFQGAPFLAGSSFNDFFRWNASGIVDSEARFHASLNTCSGCHGPETNTNFQMLFPRFPGGESGLSPFLTGTSAFDPFTGQFRTLNDLARRRDDMTAVICQ